MTDCLHRIPPLNPVILDLMQELNDGKTNATRLTEIIQRDANVTALILRIANSPFYGMNKKINSVRDACVLLGMASMKNLVYATAAESLTCHPEFEHVRASLHRHTTACAIIAGELAKHTSKDRQLHYTLGLLHELGKQLALSGCDDYFAQYLVNAESDPETAHQQTLAMCALGEIIATKWQLPDAFRQVIRHFTSPEQAEEGLRQTVSLIHLAHKLSAFMGLPSPGEQASDSAPDLSAFPELATLPLDELKKQLVNQLSGAT